MRWRRSSDASVDGIARAHTSVGGVELSHQRLRCAARQGVQLVHLTIARAVVPFSAARLFGSEIPMLARPVADEVCRPREWNRVWRSLRSAAACVVHARRCAACAIRRACHVPPMSLDWLRYSREAWDQQVEEGTDWAVPVGAREVAFTRRGELRICATPTRLVPVAWWPASVLNERSASSSTTTNWSWASKARDARIATFGTTRAIKSRSRVGR